MNKKDFYKAVSSHIPGLSLIASERTLEAIIKTIQDELKTDAAKCKVPGLGTFRLVLVKERTYFSGTASEITVPEHYAIRFKAAKEL